MADMRRDMVAIGSTIQRLQAVLGQAKGAFVFQADFHQRVGIIDVGIRVGDNAVTTHQRVHVRFPAFVFTAAVDGDFLTSAEHHGGLL